MTNACGIGYRRVPKSLRGPRFYPFGSVGATTSEQELIAKGRKLGKGVIRLVMQVLRFKSQRLYRLDEKVEGKSVESDGAS